MFVNGVKKMTVRVVRSSRSGWLENNSSPFSQVVHDVTSGDRLRLTVKER